jgi:Flp pilus assembly protein TadG
MHIRLKLGIALIVALRRLRHDRSGASALEFAIIGPLLLIGLFGTVEIALMFFANQYLESGTQQAARLIMTGQVKSTTVSKEQFKQMVCDRVGKMLDCGKIAVDAQSYGSFPTPDLTDPIANREFVDNTKFDTGKQRDIVVVRTFYKWPVFLVGSFYGYDQSNLNGGYRLLSSAVAIRNEPWGS